MGSAVSAPAVPRSPVRLALWLAGALGFIALATLNTAGYRYGASDQAFYIPAVLQQLDPSLFPRDAALLVSQGRFSVNEELFAWLVRVSGWPLPVWFAIGYTAALGLLYAALVLIGRHFFTSPWSIVALLAAYTLRHRITKTGVNTLEGYFQPRMLVFAIGVLALVAVVKKRPWIAWTLVAVGLALHTTTALWFAVWVSVALAVENERQRPWILTIGVGGAAAGAVLLWRGLVSLAPMDPAWTLAFQDKDYIFPTHWTADAWLLNLLLPAIIVGAYAWRRRAGLLRPGESGLVLGSLALIAVFVIALPFIAERSALITQLQVSRLFWMDDLLATVYVVWFATEAPAIRMKRAQAVAMAVVVLAIARGVYVLTVDHPEREFVQIDLPEDEWTAASSWLRTHTPKDAHLLADPGHAWRYGLSLRVSAERDVLQEDVKDSAIALYGRELALRVTERRIALNDFAAITVAAVRALASRYDLDYLVTERAMAPLPEVYRNRRFRIYRLDSPPLSAPRRVADAAAAGAPHRK